MLRFQALRLRRLWLNIILSCINEESLKEKVKLEKNKDQGWLSGKCLENLQVIKERDKEWT